MRPEVQRYLAHEQDASLCERELEKVQSGCEPREFTCPCGRVWVHVCDEAEGCSWVPGISRHAFQGHPEG